MPDRSPEATFVLANPALPGGRGSAAVRAHIAGLHSSGRGVHEYDDAVALSGGVGVRSPARRGGAAPSSALMRSNPALAPLEARRPRDVPRLQWTQSFASSDALSQVRSPRRAGGGSVSASKSPGRGSGGGGAVARGSAPPLVTPRTPHRARFVPQLAVDRPGGGAGGSSLPGQRPAAYATGPGGPRAGSGASARIHVLPRGSSSAGGGAGGGDPLLSSYRGADAGAIVLQARRRQSALSAHQQALSEGDVATGRSALSAGSFPAFRAAAAGGPPPPGPPGASAASSARRSGSRVTIRPRQLYPLD